MSEKPLLKIGPLVIRRGAKFSIKRTRATVKRLPGVIPNDVVPGTEPGVGGAPPPDASGKEAKR